MGQALKCSERVVYRKKPLFACLFFRPRDEKSQKNVLRIVSLNLLNLKEVKRRRESFDQTSKHLNEAGGRR